MIKRRENNDIRNKNINFANETRYGKRRNKVIKHTGQGLPPVDKGIEYTLSQESGKGICEGKSDNATVRLGTGQGYCGKESRESLGQRIYEEPEQGFEGSES